MISSNEDLLTLMSGVLRHVLSMHLNPLVRSLKFLIFLHMVHWPQLGEAQPAQVQKAVDMSVTA